jgi:hypothetical protein
MKPPMADRFRMYPARCRRMTGSTARVTWNVPKTFVANCCSIARGLVFLEGAELTKAGVVDQDIDSAEASDGGLYGHQRLGRLADIQRYGKDLVTVFSIDSLELFNVATRCDHAVTRGERRFCDFGADAARATGNKPYLAHSLAHYLNCHVSELRERT